MTEHISPAIPDPIDELATQLLECGGVLSQIVCHMVVHEATGLSAPGEVPIPETAHTVISEVLRRVRKNHSKRDIRVASAIVKQAAEVISEEVLLVEPEFDVGDLVREEAPLTRYPGIMELDDCVAAFTLELFRTGHMLSNLGADLAESLPDDAYPGESSAAVVIEMVTGTIRTSLADADE